MCFSPAAKRLVERHEIDRYRRCAVGERKLSLLQITFSVEHIEKVGDTACVARACKGQGVAILGDCHFQRGTARRWARTLQVESGLYHGLRCHRNRRRDFRINRDAPADAVGDPEHGGVVTLCSTTPAPLLHADIHSELKLIRLRPPPD
jgi:hypothetical protein